MKYILILGILAICTAPLYAQKSTYEAQYCQTPYEKEILQKTDATPLELWMAAGALASKERTAIAKAKLDACIEEFKSSKSMLASEAKQIKALRSMIQERFLLKYKMMAAFPNLFEGGGYNCVTATALFAMVMEQLEIPYSIQELPSSVNLIAYPDTKAIAIEMTNTDNLPNMPERKVASGLGVLVELHLITTEDILREGPVPLYDRYYRNTKAITLSQLAGFQYYNNAVVAFEALLYEKSYDEICKSGMLYQENKVEYVRTELLFNLLSESKFNRLKDIAYLVDYANRMKGKEAQSSVTNQYGSFLTDHIIKGNNTALADSSYSYITANLNDTVFMRTLKGLYFMTKSEFYANAYDLKETLKYAELGFPYMPEDKQVQRWLAACIAETMDDDDSGEERVNKLDQYAVKYPYLLKHNLFLRSLFYSCAEASSDYYLDEDNNAKSKEYFNRAVEALKVIDDKEIVDKDEISMLYTTIADMYEEEGDLKEAERVLKEGLQFAPEDPELEMELILLSPRLKK